MTQKFIVILNAEGIVIDVLPYSNPAAGTPVIVDSLPAYTEGKDGALRYNAETKELYYRDLDA